MSILNEIANVIKYYEEDNIKKADSFARELLKKDTNNVDVLRILAMTSQKLKDTNSQKKYLKKLTTLSNDPSIYQTLALLYQEEGNLEKAKKYYHQAININPQYAKCYLYLGSIYMIEEDYVQAETYILKAIELSAENSYINECYYFLASLYDKAGYYTNSYEIYLALIKQNYENIEMLFNFALLNLKLNRYLDGFSFYRYRYHPNKKNYVKSGIKDVKLLERNIDIKGQKLIVLAEQGNGDVLQFCRYLTSFQQMGAEVHMVVDKLLLKLMQESFKGIKFSSEIPDKAFDYYAMIGDAPYLFSTEYETIPFDDTYLSVNKEDSRKIQKKVFKEETRKKIGIVWRSNKSNSIKETITTVKEREKYNIQLKDFIRYFNKDDVELYSLQVAVTDEERKLLEKYNIPSLGDNFVSFYDNSLVIDNLDMVLSINTASAIVSAAMGVKTVIFLPDNSDWRWGITGAMSNWYKSVRLVRKENTETWDKTLQKVSINELFNSEENL